MPGGSTVLCGGAALAFPLGKVARCGAARRTVTDEGSPLKRA